MSDIHEEVRITFDLPSAAAEKLELFARNCIVNQDQLDNGEGIMDRSLSKLGITSLNFKGNQKLFFLKKNQPKTQPSTPPSLLINLLNKSSENNSFSESYLSDEDKKVRLKLKMPSNTTVTALPAPKLPSETSLSVVNSATVDEFAMTPPKVPKLIVSMRNKTIKSSSFRDNFSAKELLKSQNHEVTPNLSKNEFDSNFIKEESSEKNEPVNAKKCLNTQNHSRKTNGSGVQSLQKASIPNTSPSTSPPSTMSTSITSQNSTKMVPVKLVTVTKGEGNVRLVRVSPVQSSPSTKPTLLESSKSSYSPHAEILGNGNNIADVLSSETYSEKQINANKSRQNDDLSTQRSNESKVTNEHIT